jgi:ADP-heptose:LPS heptosyltransferase
MAPFIGRAKAKTNAHVVKPTPANAKRVLVIKLSGLADFVQALAPAKAIREYHVGARITLLTTEPLKELAEKSPFFDVIEADGKPKEPQATAQLIRRIRAAKYDVIYDLEGTPRTTGYFHGLKPWPPMWSGAAPGASHIYNDPHRELLHPLDRFEAQMEAAGVDMREPLMPDLRWVRTSFRDAPRLQPDYFGIRGRYVILLPRASDAQPNRRWPQASYVELAKRIAANGVTPVVMGASEERDVGAAIALAEPRAKNLVARADLFQSATLAERAAFVVGDDVDMMYVAAAAGASCVVLLSSLADPARATPRGHGGAVALTAAVLADLPVDLVDRQLRNCGAYRAVATA